MMRLFYYECSKLLTQRRVMTGFLLLLLAGIFLTGWQIQKAGNASDPISQEDYTAYRKQLIADAKKLTGVSLFADETSFSYRNAMRIQQAYQDCDSVTVSEENPNGVRILFDTTASDILLIIWVLLLVNWIVLDERKNGQFSMQRTTRHGRQYLGNIKLAVLLVFSLCGLLLLSAVRILTVQIFSGLGTLGRSIQSVYPASAARVTVGGAMIASLGCKCAVCLLTALFLYLSAQVLTNTRVLTWFWMAVLLGSLLAYVKIPDNSWLSLGKEVNLWRFLNASGLFTRYKNLDIASHPVAFPYVYGAVCGVLLVCMLLPACLLYGRRNITALQERGFPAFPARHTGLFRHEGYKLLTMGGWWIVLAALAVGIYVTDQTYAVYGNEEEYYYWAYCQKLQGPWGEEQEAYLTEEEERFQRVMENLASGNSLLQYGAGGQMKIYASYLRVLSEAARIRKIQGGRLLYPKGYELLLLHTNPSGYLRQGLLILVLLLFSMSTVWQMEYRYDQMKLITATKAGRKDIGRKKRIWSLAVGAVIYLGSMMMLYIRAYAAFGLKDMEAAAPSLETLSFLPEQIPIGGWIILQNLFLLLLTEALALLIAKGMGYLLKQEV